MITLSHLTLSYGHRVAVRDVSGVFRDGSLTAVVGPNGAGKSTLLRAIAGEHTIAQGTIDRAGNAVRDIAFLPQQVELARDFPISVLDVVTLGAWPRRGAFGEFSANDRERARAALAEVGLIGFDRRLVGSLSSGQFQRVLFARLLLQDARLILLDEPFAAVDSTTIMDLMKLLRNWHAEQRTVICVLHDLELVAAEFPETLSLAREVLAWGPTAAALAPGASRLLVPTKRARETRGTAA